VGRRLADKQRRPTPRRFPLRVVVRAARPRWFAPRSNTGPTPNVTISHRSFASTSSYSDCSVDAVANAKANDGDDRMHESHRAARKTWPTRTKIAAERTRYQFDYAEATVDAMLIARLPAQTISLFHVAVCRQPAH